MSVLHTSLGKGAEEKKRKKFGLLPNLPRTPPPPRFGLFYDQQYFFEN